MARLDIDTIVLSGGLGMRLRSVFPGQKTVAPIGSRAVLSYTLDLLAASGIERIVFAIGHRADDVVAFAEARKDSKVQYHFSREDTPLGTGGAIRHAAALTRSSEILVLNGDSFVKSDPGLLVEFHRRKRARISMLAVEVPETGRYGRLEMGVDDSVHAFREKSDEEASAGWINAGVYVIGRAEIERFPSGRFSLERDILPGYCSNGLYALKSTAPFIDVGTPESFRAAEEFFRKYGSPGTSS